MGYNLYKKIELAANLGIIITALFGGILIIQKLTNKPNPIPYSGYLLKSGSRISLQGVNWAASPLTLVMVLSTNCHFCSDAAPFYRIITQNSSTKAVRLIGVFPQDMVEAKKYLEGIQVPIDTVLQAMPTSLGVRGTPTLILVDSNGIVKTTWVGGLSERTQREVLNSIFQ